MYVEIDLVSSNPEAAVYQFSSGTDGAGKLRLNRVSGEVELLEPAPGDERQAHYLRAARKVRQHWANGELPEKTCWAS